MLGWYFCVLRLADRGKTAPTEDSPVSEKIAEWQTGPSGGKWLDTFVEDGIAIDLGGNGYPNRYAARARILRDIPRNGPPNARATWATEPNDVLLEHWKGKTTVYEADLEACDPDEWLMIEMWDES